MLMHTIGLRSEDISILSHSLRCSLIACGLLLMSSAMTFAQIVTGDADQSADTGDVETADEEAPSTPVDVEVAPVAEDHEIEVRLTHILQATERFTDPEVTVDEGVVFLTGATTKDEFQE